jgi:ATP-binding cassette subfamily F protein 3
MSSVVLQNVTKQFGSKVVLEGLSLEVRSGETVGLVGANGTGKTTIFKLMAGLIEPDLGTVTRSRGLTVGYLPQEPDLDTSACVRDEVGRAFDAVMQIERKMLELSHRIAELHDDPELPGLLAEYGRLEARFNALDGHIADVRIDEVLGGLGFSEADRHLPVNVLSGGQKCRAALGRLLLADSTLLLLDEPTNHLDLEATHFLERFLAGHHGGAVIVSHDRYLLDRLVGRIIEVEDGKVSIYPGNYSAYVELKEVRRLSALRRYEKDQAEIAKEREFVEKNIAAQRGKEARGRRTRLERRIAAGEFSQEAPRGPKRRASMRFGGVGRGGNTVLQCEGLCKAYGAKSLFRDLDLEVWRGQRLGITGPNGTGKTTLLRIVLGQVEPDAGTARLLPNLVTGYYDQEHSGLDRSVTVIDEVRSVQPEMSEGQCRSFLGRFLFSGDEVFKPVGTLSGGEQSRVRLARLVLSNPQVLVLDEPTNHLDIPSREALEAALEDFEGTVIVVSHDRFFLDRVVDRLLVLQRGRHRLVLGNYSFYQEVLEAEAAEAAEASGAAQRVHGPSARRRSGRRRGVGQPKSASSSSPYDAMTIEQLEELLIEREAALEAVQARFGSVEVLRDSEARQSLQEEFDALRAEVAAIDAAWQERADIG